MTGVIIISHAIRAQNAREDFQALTNNLDCRFSGELVTGCYLDNDGSDFNRTVQGVIADGADSILVVPYFLHNAAHAGNDISKIVDAAAEKHSQITFSILPGLWHEPLIEDALWEKITAASTDESELPVLGADIEALSHRIIDTRLSSSGFTSEQLPVVRRVIHATADFSFAESMRIHPDAIESGINAINSGASVYCDVNMVKQGMTKIDSEIICMIKDEQVIAHAKEQGMTRAAASIELLGDKLNGAILVIGNAPTAIWKLLELEDIYPALVIGMPVGFVGARESKVALTKSTHTYITNTSPRGGSPAASAAMNALVLLARARS